MEHNDYVKMYHQVATGTPKNQSRFVTDTDSSNKWDILAQQTADIKNNGHSLDTVHDIP